MTTTEPSGFNIMKLVRVYRTLRAVEDAHEGVELDEVGAQRYVRAVQFARDECFSTLTGEIRSEFSTFFHPERDLEDVAHATLDEKALRGWITSLLEVGSRSLIVADTNAATSSEASSAPSGAYL